VMIHVFEHLFKTQCQVLGKPTAWLLLRTYTEDFKAQIRCSGVLLDHPLPMRSGEQAIWSDCLITIPTSYQCKGGGVRLPAEGLEGGGGGSQVQKISLRSTVPNHAI
jgi:hypothetical protein